MTLPVYSNAYSNVPAGTPLVNPAGDPVTRDGALRVANGWWDCCCPSCRPVVPGVCGASYLIYFPTGVYLDIQCFINAANPSNSFRRFFNVIYPFSKYVNTTNYFVWSNYISPPPTLFSIGVYNYYGTVCGGDPYSSSSRSVAFDLILGCGGDGLWTITVVGATGGGVVSIPKDKPTQCPAGFYGGIEVALA
jgi:hypothetical protein